MSVLALLVSIVAIALPFAYNLYASRSHALIKFPSIATGCVGRDPLVIEVVNDGGGPIKVQRIEFGLSNGRTDQMVGYSEIAPLKSGRVGGGAIVRSDPIEKRLDKGEFSRYVFSGRTLLKRDAATVRVITADDNHYDESTQDALYQAELAVASAKDAARLKRFGVTVPKLPPVEGFPEKLRQQLLEQKRIEVQARRRHQSVFGYPCER